MILGSKIKLREKTLADAPNDYTWRADPELAALDAAPRLNTSYSRYLADYVSELRYPPPNRQRFGIETLDGKHVGNCTYFGINETRGEAELGIMIGNRNYWSSGYGADAVTTIVNHIFQQTKLNRVYLKTLETNARAQKCFVKCGFTPYGHLKRDGYKFVLMELHRKEWEKRQEKT